MKSTKITEKIKHKKLIQNIKKPYLAQLLKCINLILSMLSFKNKTKIQINPFKVNLTQEEPIYVIFYKTLLISIYC